MVYVRPFILSMSMECFVKALASFCDSSFDPFDKKYKHHTSGIIKSYASFNTIFYNISVDEPLMELIKEYEKTINTKFGGTYVLINKEEAGLILDNIYRVREEILRITKVKF